MLGWRLIYKWNVPQVTNPQNIQYIPVVEIFAFLELEQN